MTGIEEIENTLPLVTEAGYASVLANRVEAILASGYQLVRICLMADVPDESVFGEVENVVQGKRDLHGAQVGGEVAAIGVDHLHDPLANLAR